MKKLILSFLFIVFCVGYVSARSVLPYTAETNGPVKKMTVIRNEPAAQVVEVYYYDSIGRLTDYMHRINDNEVYLQNYPPTPPTCFKRQYTINNVYIDYYYNDSGLIKVTYTYMQCDSCGHVLYSKRYKEGKLEHMDSTVYNGKGLKTEYYVTRDSILTLHHRCAYDSLGRLSVKYNNFWGTESVYTYKYAPNGDYTENYSNNKGKKWSKKYTFNEQGKLVKIKGGDEKSRFSDFDEYGNWKLWKCTEDHATGRFTVIIERTFEYYK